VYRDWHLTRITITKSAEAILDGKAPQGKLLQISEGRASAHESNFFEDYGIPTEKIYDTDYFHQTPWNKVISSIFNKKMAFEINPYATSSPSEMPNRPFLGYNVSMITDAINRANTELKKAHLLRTSSTRLGLAFPGTHSFLISSSILLPHMLSNIPEERLREIRSKAKLMPLDALRLAVKSAKESGFELDELAKLHLSRLMDITKLDYQKSAHLFRSP
jgi:hypothetical protein